MLSRVFGKSKQVRNGTENKGGWYNWLMTQCSGGTSSTQDSAMLGIEVVGGLIYEDAYLRVKEIQCRKASLIVWVGFIQERKPIVTLSF